MGCCASSEKDEFDSIISPQATVKTPAPPPPEAEPKPKAAQRVNQYIVVKEIGRGTFGKVMMAQTLDDQGRVDGTFALKQMDMVFLRKKMRRGGAKNGADEMVKREIATMKKLHHPNIALLHDVIDDVEAKQMYVVSEFLANGSLEQRRAKSPGGVVALVELRVFVRQMVAALNYLHMRLQIAHRDIKPENVMLDGNDVVKLIDFGTAEVFTSNEDGSAMDLTSKAAGTPAFYAPEMCNINIDEYEMLPTDIWALGVTVYQLAYGFLPFKETGMMQLMEEIDEKVGDLPPICVATLLAHVLTHCRSNVSQAIDFPDFPRENETETGEQGEELRELLKGMLVKGTLVDATGSDGAGGEQFAWDATARWDIEAVMSNRWVTNRNSLSFTFAELSTGATVPDLSPHDIEDSVRPRLKNIQTAAHLIVQLQRLRSQATDRITERENTARP